MVLAYLDNGIPVVSISLMTSFARTQFAGRRILASNGKLFTV